MNVVCSTSLIVLVRSRLGSLNIHILSLVNYSLIDFNLVNPKIII
jgi:hypothetical protein